ncbi:phage protein NinX family protein [Proteus terrae]|uniref:phage protein NinX family protein n=1 Tax=Proteus terrae TaxID=1574161 RepID=UPI001330C56D|nr:phage protein NinX family protein [Proteus terrae]
MNKYTELSDFEINKKVAEKLGAEWFVTTTVWDELVVMVGSKWFKPCNNPSDAMPIIIENEISMIKSSGGWMCCHGSVGQVEHKNLYRGAMELFLLMKDAENNQ